MRESCCMTAARSLFRKGLVWGLTAGLIPGVPTGVALKATGYDSDKLYGWLALLGFAYVITLLIAASLVVTGRGSVAAGLVCGATLGMALAPFLVVSDIVMHSA